MPLIGDLHGCRHAQRGVAGVFDRPITRHNPDLRFAAEPCGKVSAERSGSRLRGWRRSRTTIVPYRADDDDWAGRLEQGRGCDGSDDRGCGIGARRGPLSREHVRPRSASRARIPELSEWCRLPSGLCTERFSIPLVRDAIVSWAAGEHAIADLTHHEQQQQDSQQHQHGPGSEVR